MTAPIAHARPTRRRRNKRRRLRVVAEAAAENLGADVGIAADVREEFVDERRGLLLRGWFQPRHLAQHADHPGVLGTHLPRRRHYPGIVDTIAAIETLADVGDAEL